MKKEFLKAISNGLVDRSLRTPSRWGERKIWMPSPFEGLMDFGPFPWLPGILNIMEGQVSGMKASQIGFSVVAMVKALFTAIELRQEAMIVQPTAQDAGIFAQSRLDAIIAQSPALRDAFPKNDSVALKTTKYHSHIFLRGSISERGLVGQPVSVAIIDEYDRCNQAALALIKKRMSGRPLADRHVFVLSTPTLPERAIDKQYHLGTQSHFMFGCPGCKRSIELLWPESVEIIGDGPKDPACWDSYFKCHKCGCKLEVDERGFLDTSIRTKPWLTEGHWEANAIEPYHHSFYIPQMYGPNVTPGEMVIESFEAELSEESKTEFVNQSLGLPYIMEGARLNLDIINKCRADHSLSDEAPAESGRMIVMGIDTGNMLDCVITEYVYIRDPGFEPHLNSVAKVLQIRRIPRSAEGYRQLGNLMRDYSMEHAVIDFQPETTKAEEFATEFYGGVSLCQYRPGTLGTDVKCRLNENRLPILTVDDTSFMDLMMSRFHRGSIQIPKDVDYIFLEHLQSPIRTIEYDTHNRARAVYVNANNSADHLAHALVLCEVAHMRAYVKQSGRSVGNDDSIRDF